MNNWDRTDLNLKLRKVAEKGDIESVKVLVGQGADLHFNDDEVLRHFNARGDAAAVTYILEQGAHPDCHGGDALFTAAHYGYADCLRALLTARGPQAWKADPTRENSRALREAAKRNFPDCMRILMAAGADIHANHDIVLSEAALTNATQAIICALKAGADPLSEPVQNQTNIELAAYCTESLPYLLAASPKTTTAKAKRIAAAVAKAAPGRAALWLANQFTNPPRANTLAQARQQASVQLEFPPCLRPSFRRPLGSDGNTKRPLS